MNDQRRHVEFLEVFGEIRFGERLDTVESVLVTGPHPLEPERVHHALRDLGTGPVGPEKRAAGEILVELRAVGDGAKADPIEHLNLIHISEPTRLRRISYAVFCLKKKKIKKNKNEENSKEQREGKKIKNKKEEK